MHQIFVHCTIKGGTANLDLLKNCVLFRKLNFVIFLDETHSGLKFQLVEIALQLASAGVTYVDFGVRPQVHL